MSQIQIDTVRALTDNYCYVIRRAGSRQAVVIDPSESQPIEQFLEDEGLNLGLIINTHHHHDHIGGNNELQSKYGAPIYCSQFDFDRVPNADRGLKDGETFDFDNVRFRVIAIPGHTRGQIALQVRDANALFVGDTLFAMGCGRLFEENPSVMFASLKKILALEPQTKLYFGHEYTETNAKFAMGVEPANADISARLERTRTELTEQGYADAPTLTDERKVNPFFRTESQDIRKTLGLEHASDLDVFTRLREMRNDFRA
jgi:hydroxyacylglutathione hydrolase